MTTIQPGTRCGCRAGHDSGAACCNYSLSYARRAELERVPELIETCQADAVRMVTVRPRAVSCGCCTDGCVCEIHQDVPQGKPVHCCDYHRQHGRSHQTERIEDCQVPMCAPCDHEAKAGTR